MRRRCDCHPCFRRFHDSPPERGEEGWAGVASSFERVRQQTGDVATASWLNMSNSHTELTRVNKMPTNCSINCSMGFKGSAASA